MPRTRRPLGAEVVLTTNLWTEAGLVNCARGTVEGILKPRDDRRARIALVDLPMYCGPTLPAIRPTVVPITQVRSGSTKGMLAWAITIHKAQGMTIDLGRRKVGLSFVALSRAKTFEGLRVHARPGQLQMHRRRKLCRSQARRVYACESTGGRDS
jgi:ATP-dependent exoDNAse (exonuclease V) alpha subunit